MFISQGQVRAVGSAIEVVEPIVYSSAVAGAPLAISVPAEFETDLEFVPPPARRFVSPGARATPAVVVYAFLRDQGHAREIAVPVLQEALKAAGVPILQRLLFRLSL